jgi:TonB family protein
MVRAQPSELLEAPRPKAGISWWWLAPCLLAIAAFSLFWGPFWRLANNVPFSGNGNAAGAPAPSQLGFSASHEGSDWRLVWNRDVLTRLNAVGAMLTIRDGGVDRLQFLSSQDLAAGAIFYVPRTSDLTFNLKVALSAGPEIEEQIRVLGATPDHVPQLASSVQQPRRIGDAARERGQTPGPEAAKAVLREFHPPAAPAPATAQTHASALDTALPDVKLPTAAAPQIPQAALTPPAPARPAAEAPKPAAPTTSPEEMAGPPRPSPVLNPVTRVDPAPIRSVPASWPRSVANRTPMEVRILVRIDPRGRVVSATPVRRTVSNFPFVDAALTASRSWAFSPALENGQPVSSETVLTFRFTP